MTPEEIRQSRVRYAERQHDVETAFGTMANNAAVKNAEEALKAVLLVNGGSCVAMLAFIGTMASRDAVSAAQIASISEPLIGFACGVAAALVATALAYFTNLNIAESSSRKDRTYEHPYVVSTPNSRSASRRGETFRWLSMIVVAISIGCFIWGLWSAQLAFRGFNQAKSAPIVSTGAKP